MNDETAKKVHAILVDAMRELTPAQIRELIFEPYGIQK